MSAAGRCGATELQPSVVLPPLCGRATTGSVYDGATALQPPRFARRPARGFLAATVTRRAASEQPCA
jgi:hypothetical protein